MSDSTPSAGRSRPRPGSNDETRVVWAALGVASALLAGLSVGPTSAPTACPEPRLLRSGGAAGERSAAVACDARGSALPALRGPARLLFGRAIDLNRASAQSLEVLPRIGPSRAAAIVRARRERRFQSPASLQRVEGIGPRTVAGLAGWVEVHGGRIPEPPAVP